MALSTTQKILIYIEKNRQASGKELVDHLDGIGARAVRKQLKNLLEKKILQKIGHPPKVYYMLPHKVFPESVDTVDTITRNFIDRRYMFISPTGDLLSGWEGFVSWCNKTHQDIEQTAKAYIATIHKYDRFRKGDLIDGMPKMKKTFVEVFLDKLFYLDFYSIERFGKTKLGQMLLYAKQSQNKTLIRRLIEEIIPRIAVTVKQYAIDGIVFIPPTVKREVQFMKELEKRAHFALRLLSVTKIKTDIIIPQKTLMRLEDRVENARSTIIIEDTGRYNNILLVDDAVGSGATLNETAKQIKKRGLCSGEIIGLAITGSFKGFDIISEV
jgi:hypothetical protein